MSDDETIAAFREAVNMSATELERWLRSDDSRSVGWTRNADGTGESVGHRSGRRIVTLLRKHGGYDADDLAHMRKVVGYVKRHCAQGPSHGRDVEHSRWAESLKNWGHDPQKGRAPRRAPKRATRRSGAT